MSFSLRPSVVVSKRGSANVRRGAVKMYGGAIEERTLWRTLLAGAPRLRQYLAAKIPVRLQGAISAEDLLQEVWLSAFQGLGGFRQDGPDALDRWLTCIAHRKLLKAIKAAQRVKRGGRHVILQGNGNRVSSMLDLFVRVAAPGRTPSSEAAVAEAADAVQIALASLPEARRRAVWMRHIEGRPCAEIAEAMGKTKPAVNSLLFHGLQQLRDQLGDPSRFLSDVPTSEEPCDK